MPSDAIPFVIAVVVFFGAFIVAVGGAALWTALPPPKVPEDEAPPEHRLSP